MRLSPSEFRELVDDLLRRGLSCTCRLAGDSMAPAIRDGACVRLASAPPRELCPGDVILYAGPGGELICHRLIRVFRRGGEPWVQTWGDAAAQPDMPVPASAVLGRVEAVTQAGCTVERDDLARSFARWLRRRRLRLRLGRLAGVSSLDQPRHTAEAATSGATTTSPCLQIAEEGPLLPQRLARCPGSQQLPAIGRSPADQAQPRPNLPPAAQDRDLPG